MRICTSIVFAVLVATSTLASAQTRDADETTSESRLHSKETPPEPEAHGTRLRWRDIPKNLWQDEKAIFSSPFHINRENARWWMFFGGATATLIASDQKITNNLAQKTAFTGPSRWTSRLGASYSLYPLWSTFYIVGKVGNNPRARDTGRLGFEALTDAAVAVQVMKAITQRPRPEIRGESVGFFKGGDAFPSGHSIQTWALARVVAREFPDHKIYSILAYGLASTVSASRFAGRKHSASDAFAGAGMGFFIGDYVYRHHHAPSEKSRAISWLATHVDVKLGFERSPEKGGHNGSGN